MRIRLNIRRKILIGLLIPAVCLAVLTAFSYANLRLMEQRIRVLGEIDQVELSIMALRRQDRDVRTEGARERHALLLDTARAAAARLTGVREALLSSASRDMADALLLGLANYIELVREAERAGGDISDLSGENDGEAARSAGAAGRGNETAALLRERAADIVTELEDTIAALSFSMRERMAYTSETLRRQLLAAAVAVASLFALAGYFISTHVLKPLKVIERTTRRIGEGKFTPVPLRRTHDEIRELQEAFNSMVEELRRRQEQLVQSQKLSSIGTLSAGMAHQVNNPLNNISLSAQFLREIRKGLADPLEAKALDNIEKETGRARDIVRGLLNFAHQSEFSLRRIHLKTVVNNAVRFAAAQLPPNIRLESDIPDDLKVDLDPQRMSEALLNIIINGIQAVGEGPGEVRVYLDGAARLDSTARLDTEPESVTLVVEDSGCGIAPEDLPHIFDPFFTRKKVGEGTGLGLSIGYGIIEECLGTVRVESVPGSGARFFITLPLPRPDSFEASQESAD